MFEQIQMIYRWWYIDSIEIILRYLNWISTKIYVCLLLCKWQLYKIYRVLSDELVHICFIIVKCVHFYFLSNVIHSQLSIFSSMMRTKILFAYMYKIMIGKHKVQELYIRLPACSSYRINETPYMYCVALDRGAL